MEREKESTTSLSEEELQREADTVREMLEHATDMQNVEIPEGIHERLAERIRKYEEEKAIEALSEKDREALRLGRALQEESGKRESEQVTFEKKRTSYRRKKRKMWVVLAASLAMVIGVGITSVGGKKIIVDVFEKNFGGGEKTYVDTEDSTLPTTEAGMTEDEAYAQVEEAFGTKVVRITDLPNNAKFLEMQLDEQIQEAIFYYSKGKKVFNYRIIAKYVESSTGIELQDELIQEYIFELPETDVIIAEYRIRETGEAEYTAKFTYKNSQYFLMGVMEQEEFEKILKNLNFF